MSTGLNRAMRRPQVACAGLLLAALASLPVAAQQQPQAAAQQQPPPAPAPTSQPANLQQAAQERLKGEMEFVIATVNEAQADDAPIRHREDLEKAVQICRAVRREYPQYVVATLMLAESLRLLNRGNEAVDLYSEVLDLPAVEYHYVALKGLGKIYADSEWYQLALSVLERAASLKTGDKDVYRDMARCYEAKDDKKKALEYAQYAVGADPEDPALHALLANLHAGTGDFVAAAGSAERAMRLAFDKFEKDPTDVVTISLLLHYSRFRMDIIEQYLNYKANNPDYGANEVDLILIRLGIWRRVALLAQLLSLHEALRWIESMNTLHPDDPALLVEMAGIQYQLQMTDDAKATLKRVLELSPGNAAAQQMLDTIEQRESGRPPPGADQAIQVPDPDEGSTPPVEVPESSK